MKKTFIIRLLILCGLALLCYSCKEKERCGEIKKPKNLKPIDWDNYNDVYTVYWNFRTNDCSKAGPTGKNVKVFGWIFQGMGEPYHPPVNPTVFRLMSNKENIFSYNPYERGGVAFYVRYSGNGEDLDSLKVKFSITDITKKCYVSGKVFLDEFPENSCCWAAPMIWSNDIYFEEE